MRLDEVLVERLRRLTDLTVWLSTAVGVARFGEELRVNRKAVYRILKLKGGSCINVWRRRCRVFRAAGAAHNAAMNVRPWT